MSWRSATAAVVLAVLVAAGAAAQDKPDALELYRANRFADAIKVCQQELAISPNNIDSYVVMGWSLLRLQQYADALAAAQKANGHQPQRPSRHRGRRGSGRVPRQDRRRAEQPAAVRGRFGPTETASAASTG